jgi:ABC-type antimicrobial peptide transport system permease subunit
VIAMILGEAAGVVLLGVAAGGALPLAASRLLAARRYDVPPQDPSILPVAFGVLLLTAFVAAYLPACRASRVDPMTLLHRA